MKKRVIALLAVFTLLLTALAGCTTKNGESDGTSGNIDNAQVDQPSGGAMGRYVEEMLTLPELQEGEYIYSIINNKKNLPEVYTAQLTETDNIYKCYRRSEGGNWTSREPGGLKGYFFDEPNLYMVSMSLGGDGNYYLQAMDFSTGESRARIYRLTDNQTVLEELDVKYLNEKTDSVYGEPSYPYIKGIYAAESGKIVLFSGYTGSEIVILSPEGEVVDKLSASEQAEFKCMGYGDFILYPSENAAGMELYNIETEETTVLPALTEESNKTIFAVEADGSVLAMNTAGIQRFTAGAESFELIIDGTLNSMNMPTLQPAALYISGEEQKEYHIPYTNEEGQYTLMHYYYDSSIAAEPSRELNVYSLKENASVRQAISLYHSMNRDVKINYTAAMTDEDENVSDYIRALNTELLNGNGADVLILDGMQSTSYIEKGVLCDLTQLIKPLEDSGQINTNISKHYYNDGKIYSLPIRYSIPVAAGDKEAVGAMQSIEGIADYIRAGNTEAFTSEMTNRELMADYLALYSEELFTKEGTLDEGKFAAFLENIKVIADNIADSETEGDMYSGQNNGFSLDDGLFDGDMLQLAQKKISQASMKIKNIGDLMVVCAAVKEDKDLTYELLNNTFLPKGIVGVNQAAKDIELAKEFMEFLLSDTVQDADVSDGFPINNKIMTKWLERENDNVMFTLSDHEGNLLEGTWPVKAQREEFGKKVDEMTNLININYTLTEMILNETDAFFSGKADAAKIAAAVKTKVDTYLAE